jgi:hypothetical protein
LSDPDLTSPRGERHVHEVHPYVGSELLGW